MGCSDSAGRILFEMEGVDGPLAREAFRLLRTSCRFRRSLWNGEGSHMEAKELRDMSIDDLTQKRTELREEIGHLKLKRATSRLENPMKLGQTKRDLARVETILREKAFQSGKGAA